MNQNKLYQKLESVIDKIRSAEKLFDKIMESKDFPLRDYMIPLVDDYRFEQKEAIKIIEEIENNLGDLYRKGERKC